MILVGMSRSFERKIAARAVPDTPIDLKRKKVAKVEVAPDDPPAWTPPPLPKPPAVVSVVPITEAACMSEIPIRRRPKAVDIQKAVCIAFAGASGALTVNDLVSRRRTQNVVWPRQVAMFLIKKLTLMSLPEIGRRFGGKDHTTILHGCQKVTRKLAADPSITITISKVLEILAAQGFTVPTLAEMGIREIVE